MGNRLTILLLLFYITKINILFGQSILEQKVIEELNKYRAKYGLVKLFYDAQSSEMTKHHAEYLNKLNEMNIFTHSHDENIDVLNYSELDFNKRSEKVLPINWIAENQLQLFYPRTNMQKSAKAIIDLFHNSEGHRENMQFKINPDLLDKVTPVISICILEKHNYYVVVMNFGYKLN